MGMQSPALGVCLQRSCLATSLAGNAVDLLTITAAADSGKPLEQRLGVVLSGAWRCAPWLQLLPSLRVPLRCSNPVAPLCPLPAARVHPGETNASWMMKGALQQLLADTPEAAALREQFVFKVRRGLRARWGPRTHAATLGTAWTRHCRCAAPACRWCPCSIQVRGRHRRLSARVRSSCVHAQPRVTAACVAPPRRTDGVIAGNYRCSLAGLDLNRVYQAPDARLQPVIYAFKEMVRAFSRAREVVLSCDLHGHSRRHGIFM
jgi:hypothetical protein